MPRPRHATAWRCASTTRPLTVVGPTAPAGRPSTACRAPCRSPLRLASDDTWGGFNVYGTVDARFSDDDEQLCQAFAGQASIVVSNVQAYWAAFELSANLSRAMQSRAVIEQAKGVLMSSHRISAEAAFDLLVERSQTENRKLRDIAADVVHETPGGDGG